MTLEFGLVYPNMNEYVDPRLVMQAAVTAEESGFDYFLIWDHYMLPKGRLTMFEAWSLLSYVAARTERLRLGTCVTPIPFRPPAQFAKVVANIDYLSGGRVILGVGAGWHQPEFEAYSVWDDAPTRVAKTREGLELMVRLWNEPSVDFRGRFYNVEGAVLEPKPRQRPHPELWFGTTGKAMLRMASELGTGWIPNQLNPKEYATIAATLKAKKRKDKFTFALNLFDPLPDERKYAESIEAFRKAGCNSYAVNWKYGREEFLDKIRWFGRQVIASNR